MTVPIIAAVAAAQVDESAFLDRSVTIDGRNYAYRVYAPRSATSSLSPPIILALHGSGGRGRDGRRPSEVGLGLAIRQHPERFPAIVVFPQAPEEFTWQDAGANVALAVLDKSIREFNADMSRVYLVGNSMGGNGVWYLAYNYPDRFAALVAVCGWVSERAGNSGSAYPAIAPGDAFATVASRVQRIPIRMFHGDADTAVPVDESRRLASALRAVGTAVQYTELQGVGHNAWDPAFALAELPTWLLAQRRQTGR
jgi:predicted peptidase